jgi:2'-5' RNA ligase
MAAYSISDVPRRARQIQAARREAIMSDGPVVIFAALEPDAALKSLVASYKQLVRELVGEQPYLADPPHLTIYLAEFPSVDAALEPWAKITGGDDFRLTLVGWHVFESDALTGNHTLVCEIAAADKARLRLLQREVVELLAPARDQAATRKRFAPRVQYLTAAQQQCVERFGFPYLADDWQPHLTIASIRPADWPAAWRVLEPQAPRGPFRCARLRLYRLVDGEHVALDGLGGD